MSELSSDVRHLVDLTRRARTPDDEAKRRLAARIAVALGTSGAIGASTTAASAASGWLGGLGVKAAAALLVGAGASAILLGAFGPTPGRLPAPRASAAINSSPAASIVGPAASLAPSARDEPKLALEPRAPLAPRSASVAHELAEEARLLHLAQAAWRAGQSERALELANQHAQRFPRSQLASERDALRVLSLCQLGQTQAAKRVGARLLQSAHGSPWYSSIAASCAAR